MTEKQKNWAKKLAAAGFDPATSRLWASRANLCATPLKSCVFFNNIKDKLFLDTQNVPWIAPSIEHRAQPAAAHHHGHGHCKQPLTEIWWHVLRRYSTP